MLTKYHTVQLYSKVYKPKLKVTLRSIKSKLKTWIPVSFAFWFHYANIETKLMKALETLWACMYLSLPCSQCSLEWDLIFITLCITGSYFGEQRVGQGSKSNASVPSGIECFLTPLVSNVLSVGGSLGVSRHFCCPVALSMSHYLTFSEAKSYPRGLAYVYFPLLQVFNSLASYLIKKTSYFKFLSLYIPTLFPSPPPPPARLTTFPPSTPQKE